VGVLAGWLALIALAGLEARRCVGQPLRPPFRHRLLALAGGGGAPPCSPRGLARERPQSQDDLYPDGMQAERRLAWMDWYLGIRLAAITAAAAGLVLLVFQVAGPGSGATCRSPNPLLWLFAITGLWDLLPGAMAWNGGPFKDAGLGSDRRLQLKRTPRRSRSVPRWAGDDATDAGRQTLMPVVPPCGATCSDSSPPHGTPLRRTWLALSLYQNGLPTWDSSGSLARAIRPGSRLCWSAPLCPRRRRRGRGELHYVRRFPELPPPLLVAFTFAPPVSSLSCSRSACCSPVPRHPGAGIHALRGVADQQAGTIGGLGPRVLSSSLRER